MGWSGDLGSRRMGRAKQNPSILVRVLRATSYELRATSYELLRLTALKSPPLAVIVFSIASLTISKAYSVASSAFFINRSLIRNTPNSSILSSIEGKKTFHLSDKLYNLLAVLLLSTPSIEPCA